MQKVSDHAVAFKTAIKDYLTSNGLAVGRDGQDQTSDFLRFVFDYHGVQLDADDFQRRKRTKNVVPHCERCTARRANGEQCTRRRTPGGTFCGTHVKGIPHGVVATDGQDVNVCKVTVWVEEVNGINYYVDDAGNVYRHEDILNNSPSPAIIAKWERSGDGAVCIPAFENTW